MSKSSEQKLKILYLLKYLSEYTDENYPASMAEIIEYLSKQGINSERKSIYSDIEALNKIGYDIVFKKEHPSGYFMGSRDFELAELKLLVDAVQSSKFITEKKSNALIGKIEKLTNHHVAKQLQRQVYVANRVKADNESILYNIDYIHEAIFSSHKIEFTYLEWNLEKKLVPRNNGKSYIVDPIMLVWDDENYYLVAWDNEGDTTKHYRVDKMADISLSATKKTISELSPGFDPAEYSKEHFGMFGGNKETVMITFSNKLIGVVIDRFGRNVTIMKEPDGKFVARVKVQVSDQFFAWISSFRGDAVIKGPENIVSEYHNFLNDILNRYGDWR